MISAGAVVTHWKFGTVAFVVQRPRPDGFVDIIAKAADEQGRVLHQGLPASPGDLTVVTLAPSFVHGQKIQRDGIELTVLEDMGAAVRFHVGEHRHPLTGGGSLKMPAGNSTTLSKATLVLETLS